MNVLNIHERMLDATASEAAPLVDSLGSPGDLLWPGDRWPPMRLDGPLSPGTRGGHHPIRYTVESFDPGRHVRFRFTSPRGFEGIHMFEIEPVPAGGVRIRHTLEMKTRGLANFSWPLIFRPLHDALVEDAFDRAEERFGPAPPASVWSPRVRALRWLLRNLRFRRRRSGKKISVKRETSE